MPRSRAKVTGKEAKMVDLSGTIVFLGTMATLVYLFAPHRS